jgi:hypothetical protein
LLLTLKWATGVGNSTARVQFARKVRPEAVRQRMSNFRQRCESAAEESDLKVSVAAGVHGGVGAPGAPLIDAAFVGQQC